MTAEKPQHWYERLIPAPLRGVFARSNENVTLTQEEQREEKAWQLYKQERDSDPARATRKFFFTAGYRPLEGTPVLAENLTEEQEDAEEFDSGQLETGEWMDETRLHIYKGQTFSTEQGQWVAYYEPINPDNEAQEWTHAKALRMFGRMADVGIKPSQTGKALADFGARLDHEAAKFDYSNDL